MLAVLTGYRSTSVAMSRRSLLAPGLVVALLAVACSVGGGPTSPSARRSGPRRGSTPVGRPPPVREPLTVAFPRISTADGPMGRVRKIGGFMESRWPRIHLRPDANAMGTVVAFRIAIDYDRWRGDHLGWENSVHRLSGDLHEASVELLQLSAQCLPRLRFATVWDDERLMFFWSRRQILGMGPAWMYRDFDAYEALTRLAAYQPPLLVWAKQQELHNGPPTIA